MSTAGPYENVNPVSFFRRTPNAPGVRTVYGYDSEETTPTGERAPHRGLPSPSLTVIVTIDDPLHCAPTEDDWAARRGPTHDVCLGGFHTSPVYLQRPDRQAGIQVEIHPLACRRLFGMPASALAELTQEGEGVLGPRIRRLHSRVGSASGIVDATALVDRELADLAHTNGEIAPPRREVVGAWNLLERTGGVIRIDEVAALIGLSTRHLNSLVTRELGIGTKSLADLFRFDAAHHAVVRELRAGRKPELSRIAAAHGFSDQSHLIRAYHGHAGTTPTGWIAEEFRNVQSGGHVPVV